MSESPVAEAKPSAKSPIEELLEAAWTSVKAMLAEDSDRWTAALTSPVAKASEPAKQAAGRQVQREQHAALVHAAMEFQVRLALAQRHKAIHMPSMGPILTDLAGFAQAVAGGTKVTCLASACEWRGEAADAGPTGACPKCGERCRPDAPEKKLLGPTGQVIQA